MIKKTIIETPIGEMIAGATKEGICETTIKEGSNRHLRMLKRQLKEYFKGKRKEFSLQMLTPGTEFQQSVWKELRKIPYGSTMSYQEQADLLKNPLSVRAVAQANGANRLAIIIPCHRVIGSDGHLVGYGGCLERIKWLLDHEKKFSGKPVDLNLF